MKAAGEPAALQPLQSAVMAMCCAYLSNAVPGLGHGLHAASWDGLFRVGGLVIDVSSDAWGCLTLQSTERLICSLVSVFCLPCNTF